MSACLRFTRRVWHSFVENKGHDVQCFPNVCLCVLSLRRRKLLLRSVFSLRYCRQNQEW
ncbi:hypothetical protein BJ322DRAFT_1035658 [Thelephora terrestris]|uniref:Uncharacterized protein n=1 Tax=Thelephora terrestris TaxID=56493 RepID=A0A9P6HM23_9AGAM|nr:hypothetical protein BJ322DRAFT_1035658 [Thelephora terrestris]